MNGIGRRVRGRTEGVIRPMVVALVVALTLVGSHAQTPPPPALEVYRSDFAPSSGPAPGTSSGAEWNVTIAGIEPLEVRLEELRQLLADHLAETNPHQPHNHPHGPHTGEIGEVGHDDLLEELLALASELLVRTANAQQPPPMEVYSERWDAGSSPAPDGATGPDLVLRPDIPLLDTIDQALARLRGDINAHGHTHRHSHVDGGVQWTTVDPNADTDGDGVLDVDDDDDDGDGVVDDEDADPLDPDVQ